MTRRAVSRCVAVCVLCVGSLFAFADEAGGGKGERGSFTLTFSNRAEQSTNQYIAQRMGWPLLAEESAKVDYNLPDESFEVYVPADYTGDKPYGLLVFCMPHPGGKPPQNYLDSIDKHHLIWVCPNNAGNDRYVRPRMGLVIDAAVNMQSRYKIDPDRVYVSGISGGGRVASMLGVGFADIFKGGGFYIIGCNFYRQETTADGKRYYARSYSVPPAKVFRAAREQSKHVFLTGDNDGNREQTDLYYKGFKHDRFEHILYLQVPGMGHQHPDAEWFEKGLAFLDEPVATAGPATRPTARPATTRPTVAAAAASHAATQATDRATVAGQLLKSAQLYLDNKQYELAREKLKWIVQNFAGTPAAAEAKKTLDVIAGK